MKVITISTLEFAHLCEDLADKIINNNYTPDVIIGIKSGGSYVGKKVSNILNIAKYTEVQIRRPNSSQKEQNIIRHIIRHIPLCILNQVRILESCWRKYFSKSINYQIKEITFNNQITDIIINGGKNILIIDDAIDTGITMSILINYINSKYPNNHIKVAAITVTTQTPLVDADFCLFHNKTLIRFPWAIDAKP